MIDELGQIAVDWSADTDATSVEVYLDITDDMENFAGWILINVTSYSLS